MNILAKKAVHSTIEGVITRADGTVEDLGIIAEGYHCLGCNRDFGAHWTYRLHLCWWTKLRSR